jgi:hypothetical protein
VDIEEKVHSLGSNYGSVLDLLATRIRLDCFVLTRSCDDFYFVRRLVEHNVYLVVCPTAIGGTCVDGPVFAGSFLRSNYVKLSISID